MKNLICLFLLFASLVVDAQYKNELSTGVLRVQVDDLGIDKTPQIIAPFGIEYLRHFDRWLIGLRYENYNRNMTDIPDKIYADFPTGEFDVRNSSIYLPIYYRISNNEESQWKIYLGLAPYYTYSKMIGEYTGGLVGGNEDVVHKENNTWKIWGVMPRINFNYSLSSHFLTSFGLAYGIGRGTKTDNIVHQTFSATNVSTLFLPEIRVGYRF